MNSYFIRYIKNRIEVSKYINNNLETLKYLGETEQEYNKTKFWIWFKKKIEYEDEELSFVVVTDNKEFNIPQDSGITISAINKISQNQDINKHIRNISKGYFILSFPKRDNKLLQKSSDVTASASPFNEVKIIVSNKSNSLANAFRKQTRGYKDEKR